MEFQLGDKNIISGPAKNETNCILPNTARLTPHSALPCSNWAEIHSPATFHIGTWRLQKSALTPNVMTVLIDKSRSWERRTLGEPTFQCWQPSQLAGTMGPTSCGKIEQLWYKYFANRHDPSVVNQPSQ